MTEYEKVELIRHSIIEGIDQLVTLACGDDELTCVVAFEELQFIRTARTEQCVLEGLKSQSDLVRMTCLEIVGEWQFLPGIEFARCYIEHDDPLVRREAIIAIGMCNVESDKELLHAMYVKDRDETVRHIFYYAFTLMGEKEYLCFFLAGFFNEDYHIRCTTANLIVSVLSTENRAVVNQFLSVAIQREETRAGLDALESAQKLIIEAEKTEKLAAG